MSVRQFLYVVNIRIGCVRSARIPRFRHFPQRRLKGKVTQLHDAAGEPELGRGAAQPVVIFQELVLPACSGQKFLYPWTTLYTGYADSGVAMLLDVLLALLPLMLIFGAIACCNAAPDIAGGIAWVCCIAVSCLYFHTDLSVALLTSLSGLVASLPIALVLVAAIFQVTVMVETGAMARIAVLSKTLAAHDRPTQILLLNCAFAFILMALGAVPMTVLPAVLLPLGYSVVHAIALPIMGYSGGCAFSLLGIPGQILATFCGISMLEAWHVFARYMPLTNFAVAAACLWFAGRLPMLKKGFIPAVIVGFGCWAGVKASAFLHIMPLAGILSGVIMTALLSGFLLLRGSPVIDRSLLTEKELELERQLSLTAAISPWIMLTLIAFVINTPLLPLHRIFFVDNPMTVQIIPGHPEHLRILSQPYLWLVVATLACVPFLKPTPGLMGECLRKWLRRSARPFLAAGVYFAIAYVFNHSGKNADWELTGAHNNMISVLAAAAAQTFGLLYGAAAPFMGVLAGVASGSQTAATAMLTVLHLKTSALLGVDGIMVATGGAIGGGVAGILSPTKLMSCAASIDKLGEENRIFRALLGLCALITCSIALVSLAYIFL